jgi:hypothetical protein
VTHYSRVSKVVIDVPSADHERTLQFWGRAIGRAWSQYERFPEYHGVGLPGNAEFSLLIQLLGEGEPRVHLDIHTDDLAAEVARLTALGATKERDEGRWVIMRDPAGLPFCVLPDEPGSLNDDNAQRWD